MKKNLAQTFVSLCNLFEFISIGIFAFFIIKTYIVYHSSSFLWVQDALYGFIALAAFVFFAIIKSKVSFRLQQNIGRMKVQDESEPNQLTKYEKIKAFVFDKRYHLAWLIISAFIAFAGWRRFMHWRFPTAGTFDWGIFETPIVAFIFMTCFIMFTLWNLKFLMPVSIFQPFIDGLSEKIKSCSPFQQVCVTLGTLFFFISCYIHLSGLIMASGQESSVLQNLSVVLQNLRDIMTVGK